jgi:site-specific DNA-methyltransferase (adenine-specific)
MKININNIYLMDCLEGMKYIPDKSVDMILCDLPYGTTQNKWDVIIPFEYLWSEYRRITKEESVMIFTAAEPFMSKLVCSNLNDFKYDMVWHKSRSTGHLNAKIAPLRNHENIAVFYRKVGKYNPQIQSKPKENIRPNSRRRASENYGKFKEFSKRTIPLDKRYPSSVEKFNNVNHGESGLHPTQKPVALFEYLIKTYTNEGETVLDNCMGSGTTAIACLNTNRKYIGFEKEKKYFDIAQERINKHLNQLKIA